jgi:hypothetical protein
MGVEHGGQQDLGPEALAMAGASIAAGLDPIKITVRVVRPAFACTTCQGDTRTRQAPVRTQESCMFNRVLNGKTGFQACGVR